MMESLQIYGGSDSDTNSDPGNSNKESSIDKQSSGASMSNFFGLKSYTPSSSVSVISATDERKSDHQSEHGDSLNDIPESDFWKGFVPDSTEIDKQNCSSDFGKGNNSMKRAFQSISRKHPLGFENSLCSDRKKTCSLRQNCNDNSSHSSVLHPRTSEIHHEKRKIFYIHGKVAPYLTSSTTCKCASNLTSSWHSHDQAVNRVMWNRPNYSHLLLTAGMDSLVKIWNVWSSLDQCISTIAHHSKAVRHAIWGYHGRKIISCSYDKTAIITDVETGSIQSRYIHPGFVMACALHPSNPNCFVTGTENLLQIWDQRTPISPMKSFTYKDKMGQPQDLLFIHCGKELISCSDIVSRDCADRTIMAWDVTSGNVISNQIFQERYTCTRLKQGPSASHFLAQTQGGYVVIFSTKRPYKMDKSKRFEGHEMQGYNIGFDLSHDGSLVYSGSAREGVHCYDYRSARLIKKCTNRKENVITDVACHPILPSVIASCSWGGSVILWQ